MKILFVGDVVGRAGRTALRNQLPQLQREFAIDFTIVNVENAAAGFGITPRLARGILQQNVDVLTSGNHIWDKKEILEYMETEERLLRPANYPSGLPGRGSLVEESAAGVRVATVNLQGRVFMPVIDCPFQWVERELERLSRQTPVIVVDFHAEASSEKMAMGWFLDGRASAVVGTHTHIPTADGRILDSGTAYISDVGMTGSYRSVIGMKRRPSISRFLTGVSARHAVASEAPRICAVVIDIDESSGQARSLRSINRPA